MIADPAVRGNSAELRQMEILLFTQLIPFLLMIQIVLNSVIGHLLQAISTHTHTHTDTFPHTHDFSLKIPGKE